MLRVSGVVKRFGGFTALSNVSFEVAEGEILGLIGPNGSGKTTMFNCISGALEPTAGSIRFQDEEIAGLTPDAICHRGVARTFQIPRPFRKLSILENVAVAAHFGARRRNTEAEARARAREVLGLVGLPAPTMRPRRSWERAGSRSSSSRVRSRRGRSSFSPTRASVGSTRRRWRAPRRCSSGCAASLA